MGKTSRRENGVLTIDGQQTAVATAIRAALRRIR